MMRCLPAGATALLVELDDLPQTLGLLASLQERPIPGVDEITPGARTLLVRFDASRLSRAALVAELAARPTDPRAAPAGPRIEIPVHYDGEDLAEVARRLSLTPAEVVARHVGTEWRVAFTGFAPGFAYLTGGDPSLDVPRRATPRTRIPAGAVALAGAFSGIYPKASPGGWQIIGWTPVPMWDLDRDPPALLQPGQRVAFVDAGPRPASTILATSPAMASAPEAAAPDATEDRPPALVVQRPGLQALLQDLGRPGLVAHGVAASGAMDRGSLRAANRLVGNEPGSAGIEAPHGGLELLAVGDAVVAVTGADGPLTLTTAAGRSWPVPRHAPIAMNDGDRLSVGEPTAGVRSYVAVRGGFDRPPVLGSLSFDTLAQVGPPPLAAGERLAVRRAGPRAIVAPPDVLPASRWPAPGDTVTLDLLPGPRADWFTPEALHALATQAWTVTPQSDRVGMRLEGERGLERAIPSELPSEGVVRGAIQVPASGQPVVFLADHPLTGGYPVIACIAPWHLDLAGQVPVGARVRFHPVGDFEPIVVPA